jgi:hypothetical protein
MTLRHWADKPPKFHRAAAVLEPDWLPSPMRPVLILLVCGAREVVTSALRSRFLAGFSISFILAGISVFGPTIHRSRIFVEAARPSFSRSSPRRAAIAFAVIR